MALEDDIEHPTTYVATGRLGKVVILSTGVVIALTIGLPVFFVVFVLFRRSKTND